MHKVIAYRKRADEYRRWASQATNAQEREEEERMTAAWDLLARTREKQLKEGIQLDLSSTFKSIKAIA